MAATVVIADLGNSVKFTLANGHEFVLNKINMQTKLADNAVYVTDSGAFVDSAMNKVIKLTIDSVGSAIGGAPLYSSLGDLYDAVNGMISSVSLGGGGVGGGDNIYTNINNTDFSATVGVGTKTITIGGLGAFTLEDKNVVAGSIKKMDSTGDVKTLSLTNVLVSGGVITLGDIDDFETGDTVLVLLAGPDKSYDTGIDSDIVSVINPDSAAWTSPEHLIDISNGAAATSRYVIPGEGFRHMSRHWKLVGSTTDTVTMTIWATNNDDADDTADTDWFDVSSDFLGAANIAAPNATPVENGSVNDTPIQYLKYMVKIVITGGTTNAVDFYLKKYN